MVVSTMGEARVPAALPRILKDYTKAAIRTQPKNLLIWSSAYFRNMTNGTPPPVKDRLEFPIPESSSGVSPGVLRVLHSQLSGAGSVRWEEVLEVCEAMGVAEETAQDAWHRSGGGDGGVVEWDHILSHIAALSTHSLLEALQLVMLTVSEDPVGHRVLCSTVLDHYHRLHTHTNITPTDQYTEAVNYLNDIANYQEGYLTPSDLTRSSCPPLQ
ncbi:ropporin-1-like protein [Procambarus clarkii]|uniref:ropporin-1-like protein n=1 Tax=Procambarus clarkii TaxID=6728 RepID=UPI001E6784E0|nr:ropporin-1-like protein [Procambarus clarkii]